MFRILFAVLVFLSSSFAAFENELNLFDKTFIDAQNDTRVKLHQQLKSLYIKSVIDEDEKSKIEILKRLIISSTSLNLDDETYVNELLESGVSKASIEALKKAVKNTDLKADKNLLPNKTQNSQKSQQNSPSKEPSQTTNKTASSQNKSKIYILNSNKIAQGLELKLNANLNKETIKKHTLDEKDNFRYIIDFEAILENGRKDYKFDDFSITLSQYNPQISRIVIRAKEKLQVDFQIKQNEVLVLVNTKIANSSQNTEKKSNSKQADTQKNIIPKKQDLKDDKNIKEKQETLYVLNVKKNSETLVLTLNKPLKENELSSFSTKDSKFFRQVISFEGVLEGSRKSFAFGKNTMSITQYNPKIVRVVLSSASEFDFSKRLVDKNLILSFNPISRDQATAKSSLNSKNLNATQVKNSNKNQTNTLNSSYKSSKLIVIDPGHGGKDSGALSDKKGSLKEKDIVLNVSLKIGAELKKRGYKVLYTRTKDKFINLRDRTKFANDKKADLFLSIHANAAPNQARAKNSEGFETFFLSPARSERSKKAAEKENQGDFEEINFFSRQSILNFLNREKIVASNKLAIDIQKGVLSQTRKKYKVVDGGVREAPFWVLVGALMPAVLLEIGYISHPSEGKRIANKSFQDLLAKGVADGVENYFYHNR